MKIPVEALPDVLRQLRNDCELAWNCIEQDHYDLNIENDEISQFQARNFFRTCFSYFEALVDEYSEFLAISLIGGDVNLNDVILSAAITGSRFDVKADGELVERKRNMSFLERLMLTKAASEKLGAKFNKLMPQSEGWKFLEQSTTKRHKITHPKEWEDLYVSFDDMETLYSVWDAIESDFIEAKLQIIKKYNTES